MAVDQSSRESSLYPSGLWARWKWAASIPLELDPGEFIAALFGAVFCAGIWTFVALWSLSLLSPLVGVPDLWAALSGWPIYACWAAMTVVTAPATWAEAIS